MVWHQRLGHKNSCLDLWKIVLALQKMATLGKNFKNCYFSLQAVDSQDYVLYCDLMSKIRP